MTREMCCDNPQNDFRLWCVIQTLFGEILNFRVKTTSLGNI